MRFKDQRQHTKKIEKAIREAARLEKKLIRQQNFEGNWKQTTNTNGGAS